MNHIIFKGELISPSKVVCIGRNYVEHIKELNNEVADEMVVFFKPSSAISDQLMSFLDEPLHYEAELSFIIQHGAITGVAVGLDLTKRALQNTLKSKGLPWERSKSFNGAAVFSPFVGIPSSFDSLSFELFIDDELVQQGDPKMMIYPLQTMVSELEKFTSFNDYDILMTGTPKGVGEIKAGARFTVKLHSGKELLIDHSWLAI